MNNSEERKKLNEDNSTINEHRPTILLAGDDLSIIRQIIVLLKDLIENPRVIVSKDGVETIDLAFKNSPDIMIIDVQMPHIDVFEVSKQIRIKEKDEGAHIPILALLSDSSDKNRKNMIESGIDGFLIKPVDRDELKGFLSQHLSEQSPIHGIDFKDGVERLMGNTAVYLQILESFVEECAQNIYDLEKAFKLKDEKEAFGITHKLKGTAGNVAAFEIAKRAADLHDALNETKNDYESLFMELKREFVDFRNSFEEFRNSKKI